MKYVLVLNSGSSSLKFNLFHADGAKPVLQGIIEKIGSHSQYEWKFCQDSKSKEYKKKDDSIKDHLKAIHVIEDILKENVDVSKLIFIGHRVVHGGLTFKEDVAYMVNEKVLKQIEELEDLAPLHNRINLQVIRDTLKVFKNVPQVVVFDTTFHTTIPEVAYRYALPYNKLGPELRKFGFHGISYSYISNAVAKFVNSPNAKIISLHLGSGCSACAIKDGKSIETSMGMTPLQGLIMGTRTGDIDGACIIHILRKYEKDVDKVEKLLNSESGLKGICGENDMRSVRKGIQSDRNKSLAFDMFCYRVKNYIGNYYAILGGADILVFTGGIGENSCEVRNEVCKGLECLGIKIDPEKNFAKEKEEIHEISAKDSKVRVLVIAAQEDLQIALMGNKLLKDEAKL